MKSGLFILPFLALLVAVLGVVIGSAFATIAWVKYAGWGAAAAIIGLWVSLDFEGFKRAFFRKNAKQVASSGLVVVLGILCIVGLAFLSSKPMFNKSFDVTKSKQNTLADQTEKMVANLKSKDVKVSVIAFFSDKEQKQAFLDLMDRYRKLGDVFDIQVYNAKEDPGKAAEYNITSENTIVFKTATQEARVSTISEEKITNALAKIQKEQSKKVYFTKGHGEPQIRTQGADGYNLIVAELENNKYVVDDFSLLEKAEVPQDATVVIIAGPKYDFSANEINQLEQYLKAGGTLFVAVDAVTSLPQLAGLMAKCGLEIQDDLIIVPPGDIRAMQYGRTTAFVTKFDEFNPATRDFARSRGVALFFPDTRTINALDTNPLSLKPTLVGKTGGDTVLVKGVKTQADLAKINPSQLTQGEFGVLGVAVGKPVIADVAAKDTDKDAKGDVTPPAPDQQKEVRVVLAGTSKFLTDRWTSVAPQNLDLFMNIANYLAQEEDLISIKPKEANSGTIDVSSGWSQLYLMSACLLYPFLFLGGGVIHWLRRRKA